ncbi:MAG TPA: hypothetical protein VMU94_07015 [Streptosporangiaceae bacterium]|nr:hypothetical protein [Streptosporangiaceae bacterium]
MKRIVFADVESTGLDPAVHFAWDVALIVRDPVGVTDREYQWYFKPDLSTADAMALTIGGYYKRTADLKSPRTRDNKALKWTDPVKLAPFLAHLLDGAVLVGQNTWFDAGFLSALLRANEHVLTCDYHYQNLGSLLAGWLRGRGIQVPQSLKLDDLARAAGLSLDGYNRHTAIGDTRLTRDAFDLVMGERPWVP